MIKIKDVQNLLLKKTTIASPQANTTMENDSIQMSSHSKLDRNEKRNLKKAWVRVLTSPTKQIK